jgi:hypothetical protein
MNIEEIKKHYEFLEKIHQEFLLQEMYSKSAKKKSSQNEASQKMDVILNRFKSYVFDKPDLYNFLTTEKGNDVDRAFQWDEIIKRRYFGNDLGGKLNDMKDLIDNK